MKIVKQVEKLTEKITEKSLSEFSDYLSYYQCRQTSQIGRSNIRNKKAYRKRLVYHEKYITNTVYIHDDLKKLDSQLM